MCVYLQEYSFLAFCFVLSNSDSAVFSLFFFSVVVEQHANFNQALKSLRQILALLYPGLMKTSNFV